MASSSKFLLSIIFPIKIIISWKFFFNIAGWIWAKSDKANNVNFKLSLSPLSKHFRTVCKILKIKSLNFLVFSLLRFPANISQIASTELVWISRFPSLK